MPNIGLLQGRANKLVMDGNLKPSSPLCERCHMASSRGPMCHVAVTLGLVPGSHHFFTTCHSWLPQFRAFVPSKFETIRSVRCDRGGGWWFFCIFRLRCRDRLNLHTNKLGACIGSSTQGERRSAMEYEKTGVRSDDVMRYGATLF